MSEEDVRYYYIDAEEGDNSNDGLSPDSPLRTIAGIPPGHGRLEVRIRGTFRPDPVGIVKGLLAIFESNIYKGAMSVAHVHGYRIDPEDEEYKINVAAVRAARAWLKERTDAPPPTTT